ncbi:zinc finger BED domain-containing protein 1-like isoform X1 [Centruroides sculpturatus]|uniref:zinc finger BED domain-containing protein 1-like isoform X1 n=1 Tax=Centruroides sculpturatus TaxID=218467 RepID=UPI000C6EC1CD|nr:zinc finger BED domain-containing protein 1-like isoform X1 [Centruroides sculpturatus]
MEKKNFNKFQKSYECKKEPELDCNCEKKEEWDCTIHGLSVDVQVQEALIESDYQSSPNLPENLSIRPSSIPGVGYGIWSNTEIPKEVIFGPYEVLTYQNIDSGQKSEVSVDNWMHYINSTCNKQQQNLIAFEYNGHLYYRTSKVIAPDTELLVLHDDELKNRARDKEFLHKLRPNIELTELTDKTVSLGATTTSLNENIYNNSKSWKLSEQIYQQQCTESVVISKIKYKKSDPRQCRLTDGLIHYLCRGMHSLHTIEESAFIDFVTLLDPKFSIPSYKELTTDLIPALHEVIKNNIILELKKVENVCIALDFWNISSSNYLSVTCHFINEEWILKNYLLETVQFSCASSSNEIKEILNEIFSKWNIKDKVHVIVCHNDTNCINTINKMDLIHIPCFSHILNLALKKSLNAGINNYVEKCLKLGRILCQLNDESLCLQKQIFSKLSIQKLMVKCKISWSSIYYLIKQIVEQKEAICSLVLELNEILSESDMIIFEQLIELLEPFAELTEDLIPDTYPVISTIKPTLYQLNNHLLSSSKDEKCIKMIKLVIQECLNDKYQENCHNFLLESSFLDPSLKKLPFLGSNEMSKLCCNIKDKMENVQRKKFSLTNKNLECCTSEPSYKKLKGSLKLLHSLYGNSHESVLNDKISEELNHYITATSVPLGTDILRYWKKHITIYPNLAILAKKYLCVPASSIPNNRAFNNEGFIMNCKRSIIHPDNVNVLTFLNYNLKE